MLDTIADFWKPVKKFPSLSRVKPEELQLGSSLVFGFLPQSTISGKRVTVTAINSYQFGDDILTSFVLTDEKGAGVSMIVAEADGEKYLAISRRMSIGDRGKLFNQDELEAVISQPDVNSIHSKEGITDYKGWVISHYKREIYGMKGKLHGGDYRKQELPEVGGQDFTYALLVSDANEHALEIERYNDGRIEVYATVYRRLSDIGEITHPAPGTAPKLVSKDVPVESTVVPFNKPAAPVISANEQDVAVELKKPEPKLGDAPQASFQPKPMPSFEIPAPPKPELKIEEPAPALSKTVEPEVKAEEKPEAKVEAKHDVVEHAKTEPVKLPEFSVADVAKKILDEPESPQVAAVIHTDSVAAPAPSDPLTIQTQAQPFTTQEIQAVSNEQDSKFVNESLKCDLPVANKIIDEAIRQEMRINDVVRRVIGLPVSAQESVQIPVTLTDQDFSLLAIRYGISTSDREAIKNRIIEDLNDFSGVNKNRKAA